MILGKFTLPLLAEQVNAMKIKLERLQQLGIEAIED